MSRVPLCVSLHYNSADRGCHGGGRNAGAREMFAMLSRGAVGGVEGGLLRGRLVARPHGGGGTAKGSLREVSWAPERDKAPGDAGEEQARAIRGPAQHNGIREWGRR